MDKNNLNLNKLCSYTLKDKLKLYYKGTLFFFINVIGLILILLVIGIISVNMVMFLTKNPYAIIGFTLLLFIIICILIAPLYIIGVEAFSNKFWGEGL